MTIWRELTSMNHLIHLVAESNAMQIPIKNVVTSRKNEVEISARINVMAPIITIQTAMVRSIPHRDSTHTEKGAKMPMHNTGIVVRKLTAKLLMPRS
ncbi:hypothetical protein [Peribacillus frigoritolerans]|uniref:hypothetical protein n=1 Tax=Peribacillus frigoritolerans TaxID=450367 RepID=UPI002ECEE12A|nr:hypothetical protein [Peribacillus frigoritolerans]